MKKGLFGLRMTTDLVWMIYFTMLYTMSIVFPYNHYAATCILLAGTILNNKDGLRIKEKQIDMLWYFGFFSVWIISSVIWAAESTSEQKVIIIAMLEIMIMLICMLDYADSFQRLVKLIRAYIYATVLGAAVYYATTPIASWGTTKMGDFVGIWRNAAGYYYAFAAVFSLYFYLESGKKRKISDLIIAVFLSVAAIGTGSRKVFVQLALAVFLYILFQGSIRKRVKIGAALGIAAIIVLAIGSNISAFRQIYEGRLLSIFSGSKSSDSSTVTRSLMRMYAMELFREHPLIGAGLDGYRAWIAHNEEFLTRFAINATYSHCNYTELLANSGIVGFSLYYGFPVWEIIRGLRKYSNSATRLGLITLITFVILDYATISYYMRFYTALLFMGVLLIKQGRQMQRRRSVCPD